MSSCLTSIRWCVTRDIISHRIIDILSIVTVPYPTSCHIITHLGRGKFGCRRVSCRADVSDLRRRLGCCM
eukprot:2989167-Pyramimonas_sp.AAC.1